MNSIDDTDGREKLSPEQVLELHPKRSRPIRLNFKAVAVVLGGLGFLVVVVVLIGVEMSSGERSQSATPNRSASHLSDESIEQQGPLALWPRDYSFLRPTQPIEEEPSASALPEHLVPQLSLPQVNTSELPPAEGRQAELIEEMLTRMQQGFDSPVIFQRSQQRELQYDSPRRDTGSMSRAELNSLIHENAVQAPQSNELLFLRNPGRLPHRVSGTLQTPLTPYELRAGSVIPAALITAIHSDLPGDLIAQVSDNVYDAETGRHLLIPQGSRLLGTYSSDILKGRNRVLVVWQRLILPNGKSISLDAMPGVDQTGAAGLHDQVDYHVENVVGATALSSAIAFTGNLARSRSEDGEALSIVGETVAQESARFGQQIIDRELRRPPTIMVRSGWQFNVLVNKDVPLEPYQPVRNQR